MISINTITINNKVYRETKSDTYMINKVGTDEIYSDAIDLLTSTFEYVETDIPLEEEIVEN